MIEKLVKIIVERLMAREANRTSVPVSKMPRDPVALFIDSGTVRLTQVNQHFLERLLSGNRPGYLTCWIEKAAEYDVTLELELFDSGEPWLDYRMLTQIALPIFSVTGEQLVHSTGRVICYSDSAIIPSGSTLCKNKKQLVTPLANEFLIKNNIAVQERQ